MTVASALSEDFSGGALDTGKWSQNNVAGVTGSQTGGRYEFATSNNTPAYSSLTSVGGFDLTGDRFLVRVADDGDRSIGSLEIYIVAQNGAGTDRLFFVLAGNFMGIYKTVSGSQTNLTVVAYDPNVDVYFRIREASGTTYWDTSTDGRSWTNKHSVSNPITVTSLHLQFVVGEYASEPAGATTVALDDVGRPGAQTASVGQAAETDTANAVGHSRAVHVAQATEADSSHGAVPLRIRALGQAGETSTAQPTGRLKVFQAGQATETSTAQPTGRIKTLTVGQALETDTAQPVGRAKAAALGQAAEIETVNTLGRIKTRLITQATETDTAQAVAAAEQVVPVGRASETCTARHIRAARIIRRPNTGYVTRPNTGLVLRP